MNSVDMIWDEFGASLRGFIKKRVADEAAAEDILQEVFVKIQSQVETLRDIRKLRYWLYQISRNTIIDYYRSRKPTVSLPENLEIKDDTNGYDIFDDLNPCVESMIGRLPPKYREAVYLTAYQGLTQKEMGKVLGISLSGAKSRVQRARDKLKEMLLDCCDFELDRMGNVISYEPKRANSSRS
jgi:RNA polymerase sigma-70 factor (ECF subfamily)